MSDHLPVQLDAGSLMLSRMSTEDLRSELKATLTVTARHLRHLADVWRELERRGEDLSGLRSGLWSYMGLIAQDELRPEIVVRYAGYTMLLKRLTRLSLAEQDRLIADDRVTVVEATSRGPEERVVSLARLKGPQVAQVIRDRIVPPAEQRQALLGTSTVIAAPPARSKADRAVAAARTRRPRDATRHARTIGLSMTDAEWDALSRRAEAAGLPVARLIAGALASLGLLNRSAPADQIDADGRLPLRQSRGADD